SSRASSGGAAGRFPRWGRSHSGPFPGAGRSRGMGKVERRVVWTILPVNSVNSSYGMMRDGKGPLRRGRFRQRGQNVVHFRFRDGHALVGAAVVHPQAPVWFLYGAAAEDDVAV